MNYAFFMMIAVIGINFVAARMAIDFQLSFASSEWEKTNAVGIALSMTLFGAVLSGATVKLWEKRHYVFMSITGVLAIAVLIYECHGAIGSMSNLNVHLEQNSEVAKTEKLKIDAAKEKMDTLKTEKIDVQKTEKRIGQLQNEMAKMESKAKKCPSTWITSCKTPALSNWEKNNNEIKHLQNSIAHQDEYVKSLDGFNKAIESTTETHSENKKTHPVFQTLSMFFYNNIDKAKLMQANALVAIGILIIVLAELSPAIAMRLFRADSNGLAEKVKESVHNHDSIIQALKPTSHKHDVLARGHVDLEKRDDVVFERGVSKKNTTAFQKMLSRFFKKDDAEEKPFIGFVDTNGLGSTKVKTKKVEIPTHKVDIKKPTPTQIATTNIAKQVEQEGRGADSLIEVQVIKPMILDGSFFKVEKKVGTLSVQRTIKLLSETGATIGTKKAADIVKILEKEGLPMSKVEFESRKNPT